MMMRLLSLSFFPLFNVVLPSWIIDGIMGLPMGFNEMFSAGVAIFIINDDTNNTII